MTQYNDARRAYLQTRIMELLEEETWSGPSALPDLEKLYADLVSQEEEE